MSSGEPIVRGAIINELVVAARYGLDLVGAELRSDGVDPDAWGPLSFIGTLQPVTRTRLMQATGMRRTTLRDVVARLVLEGHVEERPNPRDGRSTLLVLTAAGQGIFDRGHPAFRRALRLLDEALGGTLAEHEETVRHLRMTLERLSADTVDATLGSTHVEP